jgi:hypothetical protein
MDRFVALYLSVVLVACVASVVYTRVMLRRIRREHEAIRQLVRAATRQLTDDDPHLYDVARQTCHEFDLPWTDPRTGVTHLPPLRKR